MARTYPYIIGPVEGHAHHRVKTPASYLSAQAKFLAANRSAGASEATPHDATTIERAAASEPYVSVGQWVMDCACRNAPSVSVAWDLACCFECGAVYRGLVFPEDRPAIEAALVARADRRHRNWRAPETVDFLLAETVTHGL